MTEIEKLKQQLEIAIKALEHYKNKIVAQKALQQIYELEKQKEPLKIKIK